MLLAGGSAGCLTDRSGELAVALVPADRIEEILALTDPFDQVAYEGEGLEFAVRSDEPLVVLAVGRCVHDEEVREAACEATLDGDALHIDAELLIRDSGTDDCPPGHVFTCESPPLPAGSYTVDFLGRELSLLVPSSVPSGELVLD